MYKLHSTKRGLWRVALFVLWQPLASLLRRGCVVRQTFKKTDISVDPAQHGAGAAEVPDPQSR